MADAITIKALQDASLDARSLEEVVNGDEEKQVTTRKGETYPSVKKAIKTLFENGGLPAVPFATKVLMTASPLVDGKYAIVTNDTPNNGLYVKEAGAWVKSSYDPLGMARKDIETVNKSIYGIVEPDWELGSINVTTGGKLDDPAYKNRARISNLKTLAPNMELKVSSSDPALGVRIVTWDKKGVYWGGEAYTAKDERKVPYHYNILVKYNDDRFFEVNAIKNLVTVSSVTATERAITKISRIESVLENRPVNTNWINGSINNSGNQWDSDPTAVATRLRNDPFKIPFTGDLAVTLADPNKKIIVTLFDYNGVIIEWDGTWYTGEWRGKVAGYYSILLAWDDDRPIQPSDALGVVVKHSYPVSTSVSESINTFSESINDLEELVLTGEFKASWEVGSITNAGKLWDKTPSDRLRMTAEKTRLEGLLVVESLNPLMSVNIVEYGRNGEFIKYNSYETKAKKEINGYFNILVRWNDDRIIQPEDANVVIKLGSGNTDEDDSNKNANVSWYENIPRFSYNPFGHLLGVPVTELISAFDALTSEYHGTTLKENIGKTTDGLHDMYGYTLTPPDYLATVAITMHTHGNEKWNPLGFYDLLNEINSNAGKHEFIKWLKYNIRWLVIPVASPTAVTENTRFTGSVNLNRNYDYLWDLWEPASEKGSMPNLLAEANNIRNFFEPKKDEIDFHMDLHDIPGGKGSIYSHRPAHPSYFLWLDEQDAMRDYLAKITGGTAGAAYPLNSGSTTNLFLGNFGIPSITPEHVTQHWLRRGLDINQQLAKATEQICGFLYLFKTKFIGSDKRGSTFYRRDFEVAFASKEYGMYSWDKAQVFAALGEVSFLAPDPTDNSILLNEVDEAKATVLVISGTTADDNNSDLVVLRSMQRVDAGAEMYLAHLKKCNLVIAPAIKTMGMTDSQLRAKIAALTTKYNPDYTMLVTADGFDAEVGTTVVRHKNRDDITKEAKLADVFKLVEVTGLDSALTGRYISVNLKNEVPRHAAYPHTVAKWVGLVVNDLASYFAELFSD